MTNPQTSGWDGILNPGERVLWQGQPDGSIDLHMLRVGKVLPGLAATAFVICFSYLATRSALDDGPIGLIFALFGMFFVVITLHSAGGYVLTDAYRRRHTWYTLTNQRAFIAVQTPRGKSLDAYPITSATVIEFDGTEPGNLWFATDFKKTRRSSARIKIGFERLHDSHHVNDLIRQVQREQA
ncbi:hypothetical protein [Pseudoruegeria sp. SK021]|uniref:hypothetical protein n=1 Tax=Pseudoruegeria sp. SK021 TaxID=1933035 RepID=UPI000A24A4D2|nr:hypothetical protein [Pseudoruegeria sp. SK021]OSP55672.1 hypothetical protein BV911_06050 [Pseudoruegeria sp. SK021]